MGLLSNLVKAPSWVAEFQKFLARGNAIDLAVGVIIGAAFTNIVNSIVKDLFTPILGLLVGGIDFSNIFLTLKGPHASTLAQAQQSGAVTVNIGLFLNACIQFLIIGFIIFWMVKLLTNARLRSEVAAVVPSKEAALLADIRDILAKKSNPLSIRKKRQRNSIRIEKK